MCIYPSMNQYCIYTLICTHICTHICTRICTYTSNILYENSWEKLMQNVEKLSKNCRDSIYHTYVYISMYIHSYVYSYTFIFIYISWEVLM
jgi:hypothetical protein